MLIRTNHLLYPGTLFKLMMLASLVMAQLAAVLYVLHVGTEPHIVSLVSSFCFGSVLFMTVCMIAGDILSFIGRRIMCIWSSRGSGLAQVEIKIRIILSLTGALILIVTGLYGVRNLTVERVTVPMKGLSPLYNGTTIVQISDIHLGAINGKSRLDGVVQKVNDLHGDIVVITGDLVDGTAAALGKAVQPLTDLRTKYGAFYITGMLFYNGNVIQCHKLEIFIRTWKEGRDNIAACKILRILPNCNYLNLHVYFFFGFLTLLLKHYLLIHSCTGKTLEIAIYLFGIKIDFNAHKLFRHKTTCFIFFSRADCYTK